ncbi:uncharacterized protein LOC125374777 [Haliotis rufescens]|uniref:uncharacterized protein LOC125374777 n=1 Tax=Haliotis rufescens TaxID=6454 RepID=UPI00201FA11A|nr:uncharacterized protein LOC125374777 [Haliotis rufescens]
MFLSRNICFFSAIKISIPFDSFCVRLAPKGLQNSSLSEHTLLHPSDITMAGATEWLSDKRRESYGHYSPLLNELKTEDEKAFYNYTRLPRGLYDEMLRRVEGRIEKKHTWYRKSLPPGLKLSITVRHLACGDNYPSLSYNFRVAPNTISLIINEVCDI